MARARPLPLLLPFALAACGGAPAAPASPELPAVVLVIAPPPSGKTPLPGPSAPAYSSKELAPNWVGTWVGERGYEFSFRLHLVRKGRDRNEVDGWFEYTLTKAPDESRFEERLGETGREYVRGRYDVGRRELTLRGYRVDAPGFLALDEYRLEVGVSGRTLQGRSRGNSYAWDCVLRGRVETAPRE
jgi:hypothetical protein